MELNLSLINDCQLIILRSENNKNLGRMNKIDKSCSGLSVVHKSFSFCYVAIFRDFFVVLSDRFSSVIPSHVCQTVPFFSDMQVFDPLYI